MNRWNQCRLIDILSSIDLSLLEGRFPETDLERTERSEKRKRRRTGVRIAVISGFAAVSAVLAGTLVFFLSRGKMRSMR